MVLHCSRLLTHVVACLALAAVSAGIAFPAVAQQPGHHGTGEALGAVDFPISCSPEARAEFERGVALIHHMMYVEAKQAFLEVAKLDPECAMAHWGVAMTLFQPLWPTRPSVEDRERGWEAVQLAKRLAPATERERAYVAAAEAFFQDPESADYWPRIARFEQAMERVYRAYPDDREAAAFYALSHLAAASQSQEPLTYNARAAKILMGIYEKYPTHPGAVHYTIHANDVDGRASETLNVVRSYDDIAPSVPHALHMPTHIFVRLGDWDDVIRWNRKSADAALKFPAGDAASHHYPHALDYLLYAYLQQGEDRLAKATLDELRATANYQQTFISAFHLAAMPARYALERRQWEEAAALVERTPKAFPWDQFSWPLAISHFARGLGAARSGDLVKAQAAVGRLELLETKARQEGEQYFATQIEINRRAVAAWLAHASGNETNAVSLMRSSAMLEASTEKHPVTPGAILPAYELLGDLFMELERPAEALDAYRTSLAAWPRRFNSVLGAARAARDIGDRTLTVSYYTDLLALAGDSGKGRPALAEARAYLGRG